MLGENFDLVFVCFVTIQIRSDVDSLTLKNQTSVFPKATSIFISINI